MFQVVQIIYWLGLSTWFGGVLFIAMSAPIILREVHEHRPMLPTVLSVNLENQHGTLLAGSIISKLLRMLLFVELICAGLVLIAILGQWFVVVEPLPIAVTRTGLYLASVVMVIYEWRFVGPRIAEARQRYIDHADEPEIADPARDQFDRYQSETVTVLTILLFLLLGLLLFSANIARGVPTPLPH